MGEMRNTYKTLVRKPKGRDHLEGKCTDGKIMSDWMHLTQDMDHRQTLVNTVMNLWFHKTWVIS
jgi:hypothetical protein